MDQASGDIMICFYKKRKENYSKTDTEIAETKNS
jgi:hypothetical protein